MGGDDLHTLDGQYPVWESTDWTPWQRRRAICGLLSLTVSCGLLAGALAQWRATPLAATTIGPLATTLLCLGVALLNTVYWRPYRYAAVMFDEERRQASLMASLMTLEVVVALGALVLQVLGALHVVTVNWATWTNVGPYSFIPAAFVAFTVNAVNITMAGGIFTWRPARDPAAQESALGPPAQGIRRLLRWLVMGVAANGLPLIIPPLLALTIGYSALAHGSADTTVVLFPGVAEVSTPVAVTLYGVAAAFFLLAALSELTLRERAGESQENQERKR